MGTHQVCKFHTDQDVWGVLMEDGGEEFVCPLTTGHPLPGTYPWATAPPPPAPPKSTGGKSTGLAAELNLKTELLTALAPFAGTWVEYGVVEHAYATQRPEDFAHLIQLYGHTAQHTKADRQAAFQGANYSASKFIAHTLSTLGRSGEVRGRYGPATGRWGKVQSKVTWWALTPEPLWTDRQSWEDTGESMTYVPGSVEP